MENYIKKHYRLKENSACGPWKMCYSNEILAGVAELAYAHGLGPCPARVVGSNPTLGILPRLLMVNFSRLFISGAARLPDSL